MSDKNRDSNGQAVLQSKKEIATIFQEREQFLVIGLTGRIGSGCSTVCNILQTPVENLKFEHKDPPEHLKKDVQYRNIDRQERIIERFACARHWKKFDVIKVRDILTSFIFDENGIARFEQIANEILKAKNIKKEFTLKGCVLPEFESWCSAHAQELHDSGLFKDGFNDKFDKIIQCNQELWLLEGYHHHDLRDKYKYYYYFTVILPCLSKLIQEKLKKLEPFLYTRVYQNLGNVIRTYGRLPDGRPEDKREEDAIFSIAKRINLAIKLYRNKDWYLKTAYCEETGDNQQEIPASPVRIVIDSIKNLFEATYLRDRYSAFYLLAVSADDTKRRAFLREKGFRQHSGELEIIDCCERPSMARKIRKKYAEAQALEEAGKEYKKYAITQTVENTDLWDFFQSIEGNAYFFRLWKEAYNNKTYTFNLQDVEACIQNADIFINNSKTVHDLTKTVVRYICLMMHPGLVQPTDDERCMQIAQAAKLNSGCISRQVGAVVCDKDANILSIGWNQPSAVPGTETIPCSYRCFSDLYDGSDLMAYSQFERENEEYRKYLLKICPGKEGLRQLQKWEDDLQGIPLAFCFKDLYCGYKKGNKNQVHTRAQHGEEIALESSPRERTIGGTLYTTSFSCELCAKKALHFGISRIVYVEPYPGISQEHVLGFESSGSPGMQKQIQVELFTGACNRAYTQLYTPVFPLKDEIRMRGVSLELSQENKEKPQDAENTRPHNGIYE